MDLNGGKIGKAENSTVANGHGIGEGGNGVAGVNSGIDDQ